MSQNISMPAARVPLVDDRGQITREWMQWFIGMFQRAGGAQGFSNSELYGDAVALQSYDELLERIATLEAQNRSLSQAVQMMAQGLLPTLDQPSAASGNVFDEITVKGNSRLATDRGTVLIGAKASSEPEKLQVVGEILATGGARLAVADGSVLVGGAVDDGVHKLQVQGGARVDVLNADSLEIDSLDVQTIDAVTVNADTATVTTVNAGTTNTGSVMVGGQQVVSSRKSGVSAYGAYAGQTVGAAYSQAQAQTTDNAIKTASAKLAALVTALRAHGLVGD